MSQKKKLKISKFAQNHMEKCGWSEGSGLGKNEHGITSAIKVNIKQDSHGVGHDSAKQFTHHWWNQVYDKAASKIIINKTENGETNVLKIEDDSDTKKARATKATSALYMNFVKSSTTLENGVEMKEDEKNNSSDCDSDSDKEKKKLSDEDLFRICGGRTAHKGARHGLKLSGKLARIAAQEAAHTPQSTPATSDNENNESCKAVTSELTSSKVSSSDDRKSKNSKKTKKNKREEKNDESEKTEMKKSKKKKKTETVSDSDSTSTDLINGENNELAETGLTRIAGESKKSKKSKKRKKEEVDNTDISVGKKSKLGLNLELQEASVDDICGNSSKKIKKLKKSKKCKRVS